MVKPTDEQQAILDSVTGGKSLIVSAYAGTGKTTTLQQVADAYPRNATYIAFNRSVADEAQRRFPKHVQAATAHSLALKQKYPGSSTSFGSIYLPRLKPMQEIRREIGNTFGKKITNLLQNQGKSISVVRDTVTAFCQSAATLIGPEHVPHDARASVAVSGGDEVAFTNQVVSIAQDVWTLMSTPSGQFPITHDIYLKAWELLDPHLDCSILFFDEAQDANPVMLSIVKKQQMQRILVGDQYQAIYAWRGAENAMKQFPEFTELPLTASWRFGQAVADEGQRFLTMRGEQRRLMGLCPTPSVVHDDKENTRAVISRTNFGMIDTATAHISYGKKVHIVGGAKGPIGLLEEGWKFKQGQKAFHPEMQYFETWDEFAAYAGTTDGQQMKPLVTFINMQTDETMADTLNKLKSGTTDESDDADLTLTTAHRAKGLEWESVRLARDFWEKISLVNKLKTAPTVKDLQAGKIRGKLDDDGQPEYYKLNEEFANLCYVAVTRAERRLAGDGALASFQKDVDFWTGLKQLSHVEKEKPNETIH